MKIEILEDQIIWKEADGVSRECHIGSIEGFNLLSKLWLRSGWDTKYVYGFSWMGRPVIQLPEDMIRIQEIIYRCRPDVVIETGVAHGGSLIFYACILKAMGAGSVIGVDIEIRPHNREAMESHEMFDIIELIEGSSIEPSIIEEIELRTECKMHGLVILDSNHSRDHVLAELTAYSKFVGVGSYIVACDGIMKDLVGAPRTNPDWSSNNPQAAVEEFLAERDDFVQEEPVFPFNEGEITERVTYWPNAFIRRVR